MVCTVAIIKGLEAKVKQLQDLVNALEAIVDWHEAHTQYTPEIPALGALKEALAAAKAKAKA